MAAITDKLLITASEVKSLVPASANIDFSQGIEASIYAAQRAHLRYILGDSLYDEVVSQAKSDTLTLENGELVGKSKVMMAYYSMAKALPYINTQIRDSGAVQLNGNNYSRDNDGYKIVMQELEQTADSERRYFETWLCRNAESYPLWHGSSFYETCYNNGYLPSSFYANGRMDYIGRDNGLGISSVGGRWRRY